MKRKLGTSGILTLSLLLAFAYVGCSSGGGSSSGPPPIIVTPPDPNPPPGYITSVADILSGRTFREVLVLGQLTARLSDDDEYTFNDNTGTITLDFPSGHVPPLFTNIIVFGTVETDLREIDVIAWEPATGGPIEPPVTPPDPNPAPGSFTSVRDILAGTASHQVLLKGVTTSPTSDDDEWWFTDGTGEIVLDFPSDHVPPINRPIFVHGTVSSSEIDVIDWMLQ